MFVVYSCFFFVFFLNKLFSYSFGEIDFFWNHHESTTHFALGHFFDVTLAWAWGGKTHFSNQCTQNIANSTKLLRLTLHTVLIE